MSTTHARLRASTADAHRQLEDTVGLLGESTTLDSYLFFLRCMRGFHRPIEDRLFGCPIFRRTIGDSERRVRAHLIDKDLEALGQIVPDAVAQSLPAMNTLPEKLGVAYVFEGSTLGGQVLRRELSARLGIGPNGLRYVSGYLSQTGAMWRSFIEALENSISSQADQRAACASANQTFARLTHWFADNR